MTPRSPLICSLLLAGFAAIAFDDKPAIELPRVAHAAPVTAESEKEETAVLDLPADGSIWCDEVRLYAPPEPGQPENFAVLRTWLKTRAAGMKKVPREGLERGLPDEVLLLRADRSARFRGVQKTMEWCGHDDASIWKVRFAVSLDEKGAPGRVNAYLMVDPPDIGEELPEAVEVRLRVLKMGSKTSYDKAVRHDFEGRELTYAVGPNKFRDLEKLAASLAELHKMYPERRVLIDARQGTIVGDVHAVLDILLEQGWIDISYIGSYE